MTQAVLAAPVAGLVVSLAAAPRVAEVAEAVEDSVVLAQVLAGRGLVLLGCPASACPNLVAAGCSYS